MPKRQPSGAFLFCSSKISQSTDKSGLVAERLLSQALCIEPNNANALYLYSRCLMQREQCERSKLLSAKALSLNPCYFHTLDYNEQKIKRDIRRSYEQSQKLMKSNCTNNYKWQQVVNMYAKKKDLDSCKHIMKLFQLVKKQDNSQYTAHMFSTFGITLYEMGEYRASLERYNIACLLKPTEYRYYNNMAILQYIFGRYNESIELVEKSLGYNAGYHKSMFIKSFSQCKLGQTETAYNNIQNSMKKEPNMTMYRLKSLTILLQYFPNQLTKIQKQLQEIQEVIKYDSDSDGYFYNKDNKPIIKQCVQFLKANLNASQEEERQQFRDDWRIFVEYIDEFLMKGHTHKYQLTVKMRQLIKKMAQSREVAEKNQQQKKEEPPVVEIISQQAPCLTES